MNASASQPTSPVGAGASSELRRARRAFLWVGVVVPLGVVVLAALVVVAWIPEIPDPSAIHWSGGVPDGFAPAWTHLAVLVGMGGGLIILFAALVWFAPRTPAALQRGPSAVTQPRWSSTSRLLGAVNLGMAGLLSLTALAAVGVQRGLADAAQAPDIGPWALGGLGLLVVLTAAGWFLQPRVRPSGGETGDHVAPLPLGRDERAAWLGTATMALGARVALVGALIVLVGTMVLLWARSGGDWWTLGAASISVCVLVLIAGSLTYRVRVNASGLLVRPVIGWPAVRIPAGDIEAVRVSQINPMADFGGWGVRHALDGRSGVVLRAGEAVEVTRKNGKTFVVTVDGASAAASVLAAAARASA